jgi:hypothetical protein
MAYLVANYAVQHGRLGGGRSTKAPEIRALCSVLRGDERPRTRVFRRHDLRSRPGLPRLMSGGAPGNSMGAGVRAGCGRVSSGFPTPNANDSSRCATRRPLGRDGTGSGPTPHGNGKDAARTQRSSLPAHPGAQFGLARRPTRGLRSRHAQCDAIELAGVSASCMTRSKTGGEKTVPRSCRFTFRKRSAHSLLSESDRL